MVNIRNEDCIHGAKQLEDSSVDLIICDPPFGINESSFGKHYKRNEEVVLGGYEEAPQNYDQFTHDWVGECTRILKDGGSFYIISGWTHLKDILSAVDAHGLRTINHLIWKFNFGVNTTKKYVTSHYHIIYCTKGTDSPKFNTHCRFGSHEKSEDNRSLLYADLEDVFVINKEFQPNEVKNKNKLPNELIQKLILYSSDEGDTVCDFFMGNFTTAYVAKGLGRNVVGFELNKQSYDHHIQNLKTCEFGSKISNLKVVEDKSPPNQGKRVTPEEEIAIKEAFLTLNKTNTKRKSIAMLQETFGRGYFSILNIISK